MAQSFQNTEYYLVVDNQQRGPFTVAQLATRPITPESLVWTAGMENWAAASSIPILAALFKTPEKVVSIPVINPATASNGTNSSITDTSGVNKKPSTTSTKKTTARPSTLQNKQPTGFMVAIRETLQEKRFKYGAYLVVGLITVAGILQVGKTIKKSSLAEKNKQTEQRNIKAEQSLESLTRKVAAQEALAIKEQERREREISESVKRRVSEINVAITMQEEELVFARQNFSEVTSMKILRSAETRSEEVNAAMDKIQYHENEIERLKREIKTVELNGKRAIEGRNY